MGEKSKITVFLRKIRGFLLKIALSGHLNRENKPFFRRALDVKLSGKNCGPNKKIIEQIKYRKFYKYYL